MKSQRISAVTQGNFYYGDDCPAWVFAFDNQKVIDTRFNNHWHPDLELVYVSQGAYELYANQSTYTLNDGEIFIICPGLDHSIRSTSCKARYYSIGIATKLINLEEGHFFQKSFIEPLGQGMLDFNPVVRPTDPDYNSFFAPIEQIVNTSQKKDKVIMFAAAVNICCALIRRSQLKEEKPTGVSREHNSVQECIMYMQKNYMHKITLDQLAELTNLHPNYLCTLFHKYTGATPMVYLSKIRMQRARRLLRETELSIRQVAEQTGFNSASFFSKRFKAVMGIPPAEYGEAYRKNKNVK